MNADRDILANVVAMRVRLGQLQLVNSLVLSKCCRVLRKCRSEHPNSCPTTGTTDRVLFCLVRAVQSTAKIAVTFRYIAGYSLPYDRLDACVIRVVRKIRRPIIHGGR